jgi:hypothetical protein
MEVADLLNEHGYPFHYAVMRTAEKCVERPRSQRSPWVLEVTEMPVAVGGKDSRIDFVLKHRSKPHYLLAECKRVNPAYSSWCFFRSPYHNRNRDFETVTAEVWDSTEGVPRSGGAHIKPLADAYHVALPLKSRKKKGDANGQQADAIEVAATQLARHLNGFSAQLSKTPSVLGYDKQVILFPVLFTTADLFVTDTDLAAAPVRTGHVDASQLSVTSVQWLAYQYHVSVSARGTMPSRRTPMSLGELLDQEFVRTIFIVNAAGIESFLPYLGAVGD